MFQRTIQYYLIYKKFCTFVSDLQFSMTAQPSIAKCSVSDSLVSKNGKTVILKQDFF